jgi:hypothetical protein
MAHEKQMPASQSLVFLLRSFYITNSQTRAFSALWSAKQTVCSLMAHEKQMPASQSLVFLLRSLYHKFGL